MTLTKDWQPFDGDYQKKMQDIKLKNGDVVFGCWPNAGFFIVMMKDGNSKKHYNKDVPCVEVQEVRLTHSNLLSCELEDE